MAVPADTPAPALFAKAVEGEDAVAKIPFRGRAQADHGAARGELLRLALGDVGAMCETPARIDRHVGEQPFHRALLAPCEAVVHFLDLLGEVDVDRRLAVYGGKTVYEVLQHRRAHCAQAVRRDTEAHVRVVADLFFQRRDHSEDRKGRRREALLRRRERLLAEIPVSVERRQQGNRNAGALRGEQMLLRHFDAVRVRLSVRRVVQIVEFGHRGVAVLEHLAVELRRDRADVIGPELLQKGIHHLAPRPEAVLGRAHALGEPGHGSLEGMRMHVRHARDHRPARGLGACGILAAARRGDVAVVVDLDDDVPDPAVGQHRLGREDFFHRCLPIMRIS